MVFGFLFVFREPFSFFALGQIFLPSGLGVGAVINNYGAVSEARELHDQSNKRTGILTVSPK